MSGYKCPLCRYMFDDGPLLKETRDIQLIHFQTHHPNFGIVNGDYIHCPIMGCGFICPSLVIFNEHCNKRHYDENGPARCSKCPKGNIPFVSQMGLIRHEYYGHNHDRYTSCVREKRGRTPNINIKWIIGKAINGNNTTQEMVKKMKYK